LADPENAAVLVEAYPRLSSDEKTFAIATLASTRDGASALLQAVGSKQIESQMLTPFLVRQLQAFNDPELNTLINKATGTVNKSKADLPEQKAKWRAILTAEKLKAADPNKGHDLFKGTCATCHKLLGEGANVGPDLTGSNRANLDYLLDNVLDPSAVIGKGYELNIFTMKDARVLSGIMKEETSTGYKLAMPGGVEFVLGKDEVSKRDILKVSMMPEGQFDALGPENVANLVAYLQKDVGARRSDAAQGNKAASENRAPIVEGALEGEALKVTKITGGRTKIQNMSGFKNSRWSGGSQLWWTGGKIGDSLALSLPITEKGHYSLKAVLTKAKDYGIVEISLDGKVLSDGKIDFYNPEVVTSGELDWGLHDLEVGDHSLEVRIIGANPNAASAYLFGLDYLKLEKK
jgi:putative heme-binding domain-containing protein